MCEWREEGGVRGRVWNGWSVARLWFENGMLMKNEFGITIRLFSGGSFGFLGLFNLFLAHTNVFYGRTTGADQKEHTLSN